MTALRFEPSESDLRTRLLVAAMRSFDWRDAFGKLVGRSGSQIPVADLEGVVETDPENVAPLLRRVAAEHGVVWCEFAALLRLRSKSEDLGLAAFSRIEDDCADLLGGQSYLWSLLRSYQCTAAILAGDARAAEYFHREARRALEELAGTMLAEICSATVEFSFAHHSRSRGDYKSASDGLHNCLRICSAHHLALEPIAQFELASLLWSSGQFARALELHRDKAVRARMAKALAPAWLIRSHLSAAKCAIDLGNAKVAAKELAAGERLLGETDSFPQMLPGYALLYRGELEILLGKLNPGLELLESACQHFESMSPPFHAGLLDAKVSIAQHAISQKDTKRLLLVVHSLLDECDEKGCLEARARLLVLESALFVSDNPPLRVAFDDLVTRIHLIQNPALMLQALGNLYLHSIRYLEDEDQAFLMARLRRLQKVLGESGFQDLYEQYIEKRYSWAIENRLAELLEEEEKLLSEADEEERD
jgi:hypothetical protein